MWRQLAGGRIESLRFLVGVAAVMLVGGCAQAAEPARGFAVVELFTSEGCNSCPPADVVLSQLAARKEGAGEIYALGFHVDYWDKLGWKDVFSSQAATRRQYEYASRFGGDRVYTPQMVVNGSIEFVGSNKSLANKAVDRALSLPPRFELSLLAKRATGDGIKSELLVTGRLASLSGKELEGEFEVLVAVVQKSATTTVRRGENEGRTLSHVQVVRVFEVLNVDQMGVVGSEVVIPPGSQPLDLEIVAIAYDCKTHATVAAARIPFPGT